MKPGQPEANVRIKETDNHKDQRENGLMTLLLQKEPDAEAV